MFCKSDELHSTPTTRAVESALHHASNRRRHVALGSATIIALAAACSSTGSDGSLLPTTTVEVGESSDLLGDDGSTASQSPSLTERPGPRRQTTGDVPHIQIDAAPVANVDSELRRRVYLLPGVEERESVRSLPGAAGLWLGDDIELERGQVLGGGREIAHIHPDGSLHVFLPVELALEVDRTKWGELHPWVGRDGFWGGVAMLYTPETMEELEVTFGLVVASYNFVVGADLDPADFV